MFITTLPYSKQDFSIKKITFGNMFDVARLLYDHNERGAIQYLIDHLDIEDLNVIDKFFVLLKARELYVDETLSINMNGNAAKLNLGSLITALNDLPRYHKQVVCGDITLTFDIPTNIFITNIYDEIIQEIAFLNNTVDLRKLSKTQREQVLAQLSPDLMKVIKSYIQSIDGTITLFPGTSKLNKIEMNFFSSDTAQIVRTLYSEYSLINCRELLFYLSKRMSSDSLLNSTLADVKFYLDEYTTEMKSNKGGDLGIPL